MKKSVLHGMAVIVLACCGLFAANRSQASPFFQTTYTITNTNDAGPGSLREAIDQANLSPGADAIVFAVDGTISLGSPLAAIGEDLFIDGAGHAVTLDGGGSYRVFEVPAGVHLQVIGLTLENGYAENEGGAIWSAGVLDLQNCIVQNNLALTGGGIYSTGALSIADSLFTANRADDSEGGAIYTTAAGAQIAGSTFSRNYAVNDGSAIYATGATMITDSRFTDNEAANGTVAGYGADLVIRDSEFTGNFANNTYGGAVYANAGLEIQGGSFSGNHTAWWGGAIALAASGSGSIQGVVFHDNQAGGGGALFNEGTLALVGGSFRDNQSGGQGGAILNRGDISLSSVSMVHNTCTTGYYSSGSGGGIFNSGALALADVTIEQSEAHEGGAITNTGSLTGSQVTLKTNTVDWAGGAVYTTGALSLTDSLLEANQGADEGGAIYSTAEVSLLRVTVKDNRATESAGIYNQGDLTLEDSRFEGNRAQFDVAGAILNRGSLVSHNTDFIGNGVDNGGGAIFSGGHLEIVGGVFSGNYAKWGAAIDTYSSPSQPGVIRGVTFRNNGAGHWAAVINRGALLLEDCTFENNTSFELTAGLENTGTVTVRSCAFSGNDSQYGSGAALWNTGAASVENTRFTANQSEYYGGAILNSGELTLLGGEISDNNSNYDPGGGVYNTGHLTMTETRVVNNSNYSSGGGVYNTGTLEATGCVFSGNHADSLYGGAVYNAANASAGFTGCTFAGNRAGYWGGAIYTLGDVTIAASTLQDNFAFDIGGGIFNQGTVRLSASTLARNATWNYGGGVGNYGVFEVSASTFVGNDTWDGGAIYNAGSADITNSTFSANYGEAGGAAIHTGGNARIRYSTFSGNITLEPEVGVIWAEGGSLTIERSLVADSQTPAPNCTGALTVIGPNLSDDASCAGFIVADPLLGPLADNGGPTQTHALLPFSPALDAAADAACPAVDQRGVARPQGLACDIGAVEARQRVVGVDIRLKTTRNVIDLTSRGTIAVALLSQPGFNAVTSIDPASLRFGATGLEHSLHSAGGRLVCNPTDANGNGLPDLVCLFDIPAAGFTCSSTYGVVRGLARDGSLLVGRDAVLPSPCR